MTRTDTPTDRTSRPAAATAVAVLAVLGVIGSILMTLAHLDLGLPVISELGPQGRAIVPVAIGFAFGTLLFAAVAYGAFRVTSWAWPVGLVVNGLAFISSVMPWRGLESSGVPALVTLIALAILLSVPGRSALLYRGGAARG